MSSGSENNIILKHLIDITTNFYNFQFFNPESINYDNFLNEMESLFCFYNVFILNYTLN